MKKYIWKVLLLILIVIQMIYTSYVFFYEKEGALSDEIWSYGLANSYYGYIDGYSAENQGKWLPGAYFKNYISVQEGEQFAYDSVYYNSTFDLHPFLYDMVLHTVCSFFVDRFSWWYGFALNLIFLTVTQIFLFLTTRKITNSEGTAFLVCLLYGGGRGALCTFAFIRPYSMLVMLCMVYTYFSACVYDELQKEEKLPWKYIFPAAIFACFSFMTHYYGVAYVGIFTALFCTYQLLKKRLKAMFAYGMSMLASLGIFFAVFMEGYKDLKKFGDNGGMEGMQVTAFSPAVQIRMIYSYLFQYNYGFKTGYFPTAFWNIALPLLGFALVATVALLFPFRHDEWFRRFITGLKKSGISVIQYLKQANYIPVFVAGSCGALCQAVANGVDVLLMGRFFMRYICLVVPFFAMVVVVALRTVLLKTVKKEKIVQGIVSALICIALLRVHLTTAFPFTFPRWGDIHDLLAETRGSNVVVVDQLMMSIATDVAFFAPDLYEANAVLFTASDTIDDLLHDGEYEQRKIDYVIVDSRIYTLSVQDKEELQKRLPEGIHINDGEDADVVVGGINIVIDDGIDYDRTAEIHELTGNTPYEVLGAMYGQRGDYYVLKYK